MEVIFNRTGHIVVSYEGFILVWGGVQYSYETTFENDCPGSAIWQYNCRTETWSLLRTQGLIPDSISGSTGLVCGMEKSMGEWYHRNSLYQLNLRTLKWEKLKPLGRYPLACDKSVGWVFNQRLYFFGGFGPVENSPDLTELGVKLLSIPRDPKNAWNNQLVCYEPATNRWYWPATNGHKPEPRAAHAGGISGSKVYIFGGRRLDHRIDELVQLNMETMTWKLLAPTAANGHTAPEGRSWHTFTFVDEVTAVIVGGLMHNHLTSNHWWKLNTNTLKWERFELGRTSVWHQAAFNPDCGDLYLVGGLEKTPYDLKNTFINEMKMISFKPPSLLRQSLRVLIRTCRRDNIRNLMGYLTPDLFEAVLKRAE